MSRDDPWIVDPRYPITVSQSLDRPFVINGVTYQVVDIPPTNTPTSDPEIDEAARVTARALDRILLANEVRELYMFHGDKPKQLWKRIRKQITYYLSTLTLEEALDVAHRTVEAEKQKPGP